MGKSLEQYAAENPKQLPKSELTRQRTEAEQNRQRQQAQYNADQEREQIKRLKSSILSQLESGNATHTILYSALDAIGILSHDQEWSQTGKAFLDKVYEGIEQQSLLEDTAAIEAQRIKDLQISYNNKLRRQLNQQLKGYQKISNSLNIALDALAELEEYT